MRVGGCRGGVNKQPRFTHLEEHVCTQHSAMQHTLAAGFLAAFFCNCRRGEG